MKLNSRALLRQIVHEYYDAGHITGINCDRLADEIANRLMLDHCDEVLETSTHPLAQVLRGKRAPSQPKFHI